MWLNVDIRCITQLANLLVATVRNIMHLPLRNKVSLLSCVLKTSKSKYTDMHNIIYI